MKGKGKKRRKVMEEKKRRTRTRTIKKGTRRKVSAFVTWVKCPIHHITYDITLGCPMCPH
jgi:hypothetical protein